MHTRTCLGAAAALLFCLLGAASASAHPHTTDGADGAALSQSWHECAEQHAFMPPARGEFEGLLNEWMAVDHEPVHSVQDVIALPGTRVTVEGKFAYGEVSKDLEDEQVRLYVHTCEGWRELGQAVTDDDGRSRIEVDTAALPGAGHYKLAHVVEGDASMVFSRLHVLPRGTRVALFDIDGTLTTADSELVGQILDTEDFPRAAAGSAELTRRWADAGYHIVYLTGRPYFFAPWTRMWLEREGFAPGTLHTTDRFGDSLSGKENIGAYKLGYLNQLQKELGLVIEHAYGNSSTDIYAYLESGIDEERVYIRGEHRGKQGTHAIVDAYTDHVDALSGTLVAAVQPWHRPLPQWRWLALARDVLTPAPMPATSEPPAAVVADNTDPRVAGAETASDAVTPGTPDVTTPPAPPPARSGSPASAGSALVGRTGRTGGGDAADAERAWWLGYRR